MEKNFDCTVESHLIQPSIVRRHRTRLKKRQQENVCKFYKLASQYLVLLLLLVPQHHMFRDRPYTTVHFLYSLSQVWFTNTSHHPFTISVINSMRTSHLTKCANLCSEIGVIVLFVELLIHIVLLCSYCCVFEVYCKLSLTSWMFTYPP